MPAPSVDILVVDDEPGVRGFIVRTLRDAGYIVADARDGLDAWTMVLQQPGRFQAVVADVVMPKLPGTELAARVHELRPELPVLLMTGYTPVELRARGFEPVHGEVLTKPFNAEALLAAVRKALGENGQPHT